MLTPAERNSLLLSLGFLLLGAGIKGWKRWHAEIGPFDPAPATASGSATALPDTARTGMAPMASPGDTIAITPDLAPALAVLQADTLPKVPMDRPIAGSPKTARPGKITAPKAAPACPVDPNTASEAGLAGLPGVGPRTAAALAAYRKEHGPLRDIRELLNVKGIGEKKLALIAPCLILSGAGPDTLSTQARVDPDGDGKRDSE